ncbi:hypothetical protein PMI04_012140 [Sphingobium sp. AP49]|uniref:hypothetical protein n=1 Tax=Sphingobium sp. AP49 TaxID=1144307 RepID=UPI00026ED312|nr:hypothetical protein [Sphingobium sp. AP49]WHO37322.1 hypothetical protein PMI04_012140 [Sphingobium sp. AP49]
MADDFAAVAVVKTSFSDATGMVGELSESARPRSLAERAEGPIHVVSRWSGILAFCAAVFAIAYLII